MNAKQYIEKLGLAPHPEGGYYRQLFGNDETGKKPLSTIYYMLTANDMSASRSTFMSSSPTAR